MVKQIRDAELIEKIREIIATGEHDSRAYEVHGGSGLAGALLEHLLGIETNNAPVPDAVNWEIKTSSGSALVSMFHLSPDNRDSLLPLVKNFGWKPTRGGHAPGTKSFRCTVGNKPHERGFSIVSNEDSLSLSFDTKHVEPEHAEWLSGVQKNCGGVLENPPTWAWDSVNRSAGAKLRNMVLVSTRTREGRFVSYLHATLYRGLKWSAFQRGIREGNIKVDFDAKTKGKGLRDHGTKFRISRRDLEELYESVTPVE